MQRHETYRSRVRKNRYPLALVIPQDLPELRSSAAEEMAIAFALRYDMMHAAIHERVVIFGIAGLRFIERKAFQYPDMSFAKGPGRQDRNIQKLGERLGGLYGPVKIARKDGGDPFARECVSCDLCLVTSELRKRRRSMPAEPPFGVAGRLTMSNKK